MDEAVQPQFSWLEWKTKLRLEFNGALNKWTLLVSVPLQYVIQIVTLAFSLCADAILSTWHLWFFFLFLFKIFFIDDTYDFKGFPCGPAGKESAECPH